MCARWRVLRERFRRGPEFSRRIQDLSFNTSSYCLFGLCTLESNLYLVASLSSTVIIKVVTMRANISKNLLYFRNCAKHFTGTVSLNSYNNFIRGTDE